MAALKPALGLNNIVQLMKIGEDCIFERKCTRSLVFIFQIQTAESFSALNIYNYGVPNASDTHLLLNYHFLGIVESRI